MSEELNGWKNYKTWSVALWFANDEAVHFLARESRDYLEFRARLGQLGITRVPAGVSLYDHLLDLEALDGAIKGLRSRD